MKTRIIAICLFCAVVVFTVGVAVRAAEAKQKEPPTSNDPVQIGYPAPATSEGSHRPRCRNTVREFVDILEQTKSVDTFLLAVSSLAELGPKARPAIRTIIRNAERLQILKDHAVQASPSTERMRCAQQVHQAIVRILKGDPPGYYGSPYGFAAPAPFCVPTPVYAPTPSCQPPAPLATTLPASGR